MLKNSKKFLTMTVGIPTCYGGMSLVRTVQGIRASQGVANFRFVVVADENGRVVS